ncbi:MAG TPA: macro domain-containing protein, partial [Methylomicrobium sp.]|nr:macro domain-containing protein [Methylomicrobium sp.]
MAAECVDYIQRHGPPALAEPVITTAGLLAQSVQAIMHVVSPDATDAQFSDDPIRFTNVLEQTYYACLARADSRPDCRTIAIPAISLGIYGADPWTSVHALARAIAKFDQDTALQAGTLTTIKFVALTLTVADTATAVMNEVVSSLPSSPENTTAQTPDTTQGETTEWYAIDRIMKHR